MTREEDFFKENFPEYVTEKGEFLSPYWDLFRAGVICDTFESKVKIEQLEKENAELKAQIEKMKCCSNCNHFNKESDIEYCQNCERHLVNSLDNFPREEIIKDEWELRR